MGQLTYLVLVAAWAVPVLALEYALGWRTLRDQWRPIAVSAAMATLYFGLASTAAIHDGLWQADSDKRLPLSYDGFVFERWLSVLVTSLAIVQGVVLAFDEDVRQWVRARVRR